MAGGAPVLWPGRASHVLGMIEFHVEAFVKLRGETLQRRFGAVDVCMTDTAERNIGRDKLCKVTTSARVMSREARECGVVGALMTRVAAK
jgi:hypothetical protein